jgi:hypothetical protein
MTEKVEFRLMKEKKMERRGNKVRSGSTIR